MEPGRCLSISFGSLRWVPLQRFTRSECGCGHLHVIRRLVQLLPVRQLGVPAFLCFVEHAMVFQWSARANLSDRAFENRTVVRERLAILRTI